MLTFIKIIKLCFIVKMSLIWQHSHLRYPVFKISPLPFIITKARYFTATRLVWTEIENKLEDKSYFLNVASIIIIIIKYNDDDVVQKVCYDVVLKSVR